MIAANLHRVILSGQSQIWAVIRETDSLKRIAYSVINTFLGWMCISGDVLNLSEDQWSVLERGMADPASDGKRPGLSHPSCV